MGTAFQGSRLGQITLHSWRQVINLSCSKQSGLHGRNSCSRQEGLHGQKLLLKAGRPPRSHISPALCSPTDRQLCRPNSLNGQPNYLVCKLRGYTRALGAQPFLIFLIGEDEINVQLAVLIVVNCTTQYRLN